MYMICVFTGWRPNALNQSVDLWFVEVMATGLTARLVEPGVQSYSEKLSIIGQWHVAPRTLHPRQQMPCDKDPRKKGCSKDIGLQLDHGHPEQRGDDKDEDPS
jgi:hypothetical protein